MSFRNGTCLNTTVYVYSQLSPAFSGYYKLKPVGTEASNYTDGRDPRWSTWTESVWGATSASIFLMESPAQQLGTLLGSIFYGLAIFGLMYFFSRHLVQTSASLAAWEGTGPVSPSESGHPLTTI